MRRAASVLHRAALPAGPVLALATYWLLPSAGLDHEARAVAGVAVWMALWWMTESAPLAVTSLLPVPMFPLLGVSSLREASAPFADPFVALFMGGFVLGLAVEKWGLHRRIALGVVLLIGTGPRRLLAGFMLAAAGLSMFISNTATALMMMPIAVSVLALLERTEGGGGLAPASLLIGVAYASSIGGVMTLTGTQPNLILAGFLAERGVVVSWLGWLPYGLTLGVVMLPAAWMILARMSRRGARTDGDEIRGLLREQRRGLGPISRGEWTVIAVFVLVAGGWIFRDLLADAIDAAGAAGAASALRALGDPGVAVLGAVALFLIPVRPRERVFAMDWQTAERLPWGVLLLFGGGLSLAAGMKSTGLDVFIGEQMAGLGGLPPWAIVGIVALVVVFLTELTSNTATTAALVPVLGGAAEGMGVPAPMLMVPAAVTASFAFMLPVATPPNAIVFGTGRVTIAQMARAGFVLNLVGAAAVTLITLAIGGRVFGYGER
jgi:sodium-dependent dicarboxylate transporter 2/3/5